jgi:hypothetical protein
MGEVLQLAIRRPGWLHRPCRRLLLFGRFQRLHRTIVFRRPTPDLADKAFPRGP